MGIELRMGFGHLESEIKHTAPLEPMIVGFVNTIDMKPHWGKINVIRWSFAKPATTSSRYIRLCCWIPDMKPMESTLQIFPLTHLTSHQNRIPPSGFFMPKPQNPAVERPQPISFLTESSGYPNTILILQPYSSHDLRSV